MPKAQIRFIYIAGPYTKGDVGENVRNNILAANAVAEAGFIPFAPLLAHFWHMQCLHQYRFWVDQDLAWLERCDAILRTPGESAGADEEIALMDKLGKPVFYTLLDLIEATR